MHFQVRSFDVAYEAIFSTPAFLLAGDGVAAFRSFHKEIRPRFVIKTEDMRLHGGTSLADIRMQITLFNGLGEVELTAERLSASFKNAAGRDDYRTVIDCITLCIVALAKWWPEVALKEERLRSTVFLKVGNETDGARFLDDIMARENSASLTAREFGGSKILFEPKCEIQNSEQKWTATLHLFRSIVENDVLILSSSGTYGRDGEYSSIDQKTNHLEKVITMYLERMGLKADEQKT